MLEISRLRRIGSNEFGALVARLGLVDALKDARTVVVKLNLAGAPLLGPADAETHASTDMCLLQDIVAGILELNQSATVYIAESDAIGNAFAYLKFASFSLPDSLLLGNEDSRRVVTLDLSRDRLHRVQDGRFKYFSTRGRGLWLSEKLVEADFVVSLSNCKTHVLTHFSGSCKNLFGCLPASDKSIYHPNIHEVMHDVTLAISPQLNVVDAFFAMEGNGPISGPPVDCGYRVVSTDAAEADLCACQCAGIDVRKVKYLRYLMHSVADVDCRTAYPEVIGLKGPQRAVRIAMAIGMQMQTLGYYLRRYGQAVEAGSRPRWRKLLRVRRR